MIKQKAASVTYFTLVVCVLNLGLSAVSVIGYYVFIEWTYNKGKFTYLVVWFYAQAKNTPLSDPVASKNYFLSQEGAHPANEGQDFSFILSI